LSLGLYNPATANPANLANRAIGWAGYKVGLAKESGALSQGARKKAVEIRVLAGNRWLRFTHINLKVPYKLLDKDIFYPANPALGEPAYQPR
jgi:hypothetical protein